MHTHSHTDCQTLLTRSHVGTLLSTRVINTPGAPRDLLTGDWVHSGLGHRQASSNHGGGGATLANI